ncbi:MAG: hypothetical protein EHM35_14500, partial [Planctomycetaceae bacterium]
MARRYTAKELRAMCLKELDGAGADVGLEFTKNHNRAERSRRILAAYTEQDLASEPIKQPPSTPTDQGETKPAFEALLDGPSIDPPDLPNTT